MKKKIVLILAICLAIVLLIPIPSQLKDGGTKQYTAILYQVTDYHRLNMPDGYIEGIGIKILGMEVFNNCKSVRNPDKPYSVLIEPDDVAENVTAEIKTLSSIGAKIIITDNNSPMNVYGEWYRIDKQENNEWVELKPIIDEYGFNDLGYMGNEETKQVTFNVEWEWLYGKLPQGKYRIVKEVGNKYIYIPFKIENTDNTTIESLVPSSFEVVNNYSGVSLEVVPNSLNDNSLKINIINNTDNKLTYDMKYYIEVKKDGKWYTLNYDQSFKALAKVQNPKSSSEFTVKLPYILETGNYRVIKTITSELNCSVEFDVN